MKFLRGCLIAFLALLALTLLLGLLGVYGPASAQSEANVRVPACTGSQFTLIADAIADFSTDYAALNARLQEPNPDFDAILGRAERLQRSWWSVVPDLPACAVSTEVSLLIGRMVDELLITLLYMDANFMTFADDHLATYQDITTDFMRYVDYFTEAVQ